MTSVSQTKTPDRALRALATAAALALAAVVAPACAPPERVQAQTEQHVLRYASPYPPSHPFSRADISWMKHVEQVSGGRLKIRPFWGGALVGSDHAVLEVRHGVADMALITPIYMRGGVEAIKMQAAFYGGVRTPEEQVAVYRCLVRDFPILDDELQGLTVLAVQGGNLPSVITRERPVRRLEDLRGLRLRVPAELVPVLRPLGVDPLTMPMGEVYSAMSKGVVDGVVAPGDTIRSLHFSEVAKYITRLHVSRGGYPARAISDRAFNRLPPDLQQVLLDSRPYWEDQLNKEVVKAEAAGLAYGATHGIESIEVTPQEQARFDALYNRVALEQAARIAPDYGPEMFHEAQAAIAAVRTTGKLPAC
jgi:TRAP-type C4-dicarboxylate transport system substrate-binding protein